MQHIYSRGVSEGWSAYPNLRLRPFGRTPYAPKDFLVEMQGRTSQGGDRYLFGFSNGLRTGTMRPQPPAHAHSEEK
jgi:hypothetical protein